MKLIDILEVVNCNQLIEVKVEFYNIGATICGYKERIKGADEILLNKKVKDISEFSGHILIRLEDE